MLVFYDYMIKFSTLMVTILVGGAAAFISYQQWRLAQHKIQMDLYERRLKVYSAAKEFVLDVVRSSQPSLEQIQDLYRTTAEADFLFGKEVGKYLSELYRHALILRKWNNENRDLSSGIDIAHRDPVTIIGGQQEEGEWFIAQMERVTQVFSPYLAISIHPVRWPWSFDDGFWR